MHDVFENQHFINQNPWSFAKELKQYLVWDIDGVEDVHDTTMSSFFRAIDDADGADADTDAVKKKTKKRDKKKKKAKGKGKKHKKKKPSSSSPNSSSSSSNSVDSSSSESSKVSYILKCSHVELLVLFALKSSWRYMEVNSWTQYARMEYQY